jgi:hypothetical protein
MIHISYVLITEQAHDVNPYEVVMTYTKELNSLVFTFFLNIENSVYENSWVGLN